MFIIKYVEVTTNVARGFNMKENDDFEDLKQDEITEIINFKKLVLDSLRGCCYVIDLENFEIVYTNSNLKNVCGITDEHFKNKKCYEAFLNFEKPCEFCKVDKLIEQKEHVWEYYHRKLDKNFKVRDTLVIEGNRRFKVSMTEECKSQYTLMDNKDEIQEAVAKCVEILAKDNDIEVNIGEILSIIRKFYDSEWVCIFKFDDLRQYINCTYVFGTKGLFKDDPKLQKIPLTVIPHWMNMFEDDGFVFVDSIDETIDPDSAKFKILQFFDVKNLLAVPIILSGEITGFVLSSTANINKGNIKFLKTISIFLKDALDKKYTNERLETLLNRDRLTGLYNRHYFDQVVTQIKNEHIDNLGIIYIDVNGLKKMNDNFGHSFGDCYIENCANFIKEHFQGEAFRIGGDEFIVIIKDINQSDFYKKANEFEFQIEENNKVSMSIGAVWCESYINIDSTIKKADNLMYENKVSYYENIGNVKEYFVRNVIDLLQKNVEDQNFKVLFQPKINLDSKCFVGAEAILYKVDELGNYIESKVFIPEYESLGNMYLLDLYVLEQSCKLITHLDDKLREKIFISMKFSQQTILVPNIHIECREICDKLSIDTSKITIEVSEDCGFVESEEIFQKLQMFRKQGFKLSIENFGELNNEKEIIENSFDKVKLNKNLLADVNVNVARDAILEHLIKNYQTIRNVDIIVNGIEEEEHLSFLSSYKGLIGQGDLISKPLTIKAFLTYLQEK